MGNFGGMSAGIQLRTMCSMIGLVALPSTLTLPNVQNQMDETGELQGERKESIQKNLKKQIDELEFFSNSIMDRKIKENVPFA